MVNNLIEKNSLSEDFFDNMLLKKNSDLKIESNKSKIFNKESKITDIKNKYLNKAIKRGEKKKELIERILKDESPYFDIEDKLNNIMKQFIDMEGNHLL